MGKRFIPVESCDKCGKDLPAGEHVETFEIGILPPDGEPIQFVAELGGQCRKELRAVLDALYETMRKRAEETGDVLTTVPKTSATGVENLTSRELSRLTREWWRVDKDAQKRFGQPSTKGQVPAGVKAAYIEAMKARAGMTTRTGAREKVRA